MKGEYDPEGYTVRYVLPSLGASSTITLTFNAKLAKDAADRLGCTVFVGESHDDAPYDTAIVDAGGTRDSGTGEGLDAGWQLLYNPPAVSTFSGATTYNHPLKLPPGRNGLQPELNLSYSSRAVDGTTWWVDSEWVGMGWSIDSIDIVRQEVEFEWDDNYDWISLSPHLSLVLNGTSYELTPAPGVTFHGRYYAENAPELYVELHTGSQVGRVEQGETRHSHRERAGAYRITDALNLIALKRDSLFSEKRRGSGPIAAAG